MKRRSGILMPVFSLPSEYGIGSFGKESYEFIDFLAASGQAVWQVLPLGQTSFGDSPYQTTADISLNPYFCDLNDLYEKNLLTLAELNSAKSKAKKIDYGKLYRTRYKLLKKAFSRYDFSDDFLATLNSEKFDDYALFMTIKSIYGDLSSFPKELKMHNKSALAAFKEEYAEEYIFNVFVQYILNEQYEKLKKYAAEKNVKIMGDMPLYLAYDSADVWANPSDFLLDENLNPKAVAGVPPDYFSEDGQLWGNPLYDYQNMKKDNFRFWRKRIRSNLKRYDLVRIDHFRGLDRYWLIYGDTAKEGKWVKGYGKEILKPFKNRLIAEDLGVIDDGVKKLLHSTGYPGMKVLLFAFDGNPANPYLPENIERNSVCYVGTHDNDTAYGYAKSLDSQSFKEFKARVNEVLPSGVNKIKTKKDVAPALIELAYSTDSDLVILNFADVLNFDNRYRINTPSTVGNWTTRFTTSDFADEIREKLYALTKKHKRLLR